VEPASRKREVLAFIGAGLEDFSVSRSMARARGWGIPVPGDPDQVIYVWYDALANYISAPGYATDPALFDAWWTDAWRVHVIGKGIIRFHAVYWPAMLLSAGLALPDVIFVHEYLTVNGTKISKSAGGAVDPVETVASYGTDALRWWLVSEVARAGDTDFTVARMVTRANEDLANNIGNLVNRTVSMVNRYRDGQIPVGRPADAAGAALRAVRAEADAAIAAALGAFDFRRATEAIVRIGDEGNRYIEAVRPWELAKAAPTDPDASARLDAVLGELVDTCRDVARHLTPFLPQAAARIAAQCGDGTGTVAVASPVFPRLEMPVAA
jgi:methionyl-tRNA synthetase